MIALVRFQVAGYVRSLRVLQPLIVVLLLVLLVLLEGPAGDRELVVGSFGDVAAFMFPVWAWAARALLDTQPDEQQGISGLAVGAWSGVAGLIAAYLLNLGLGLLALVVPVGQAVGAGVGVAAIGAGLGLCLLSALAGTSVGAWTSRRILPNAGISLLALISLVVAALLLSLSPLSWIAVPMVQWLHAAHDGPTTLTASFPEIALQLSLWTTAVTGTYLITHQRRA